MMRNVPCQASSDPSPLPFLRIVVQDRHQDRHHGRHQGRQAPGQAGTRTGTGTGTKPGHTGRLRLLPWIQSGGNRINWYKKIPLDSLPSCLSLFTQSRDALDRPPVCCCYTGPPPGTFHFGTRACATLRCETRVHSTRSFRLK